MDSIAKTLATRQSTHGTFSEAAKTVQRMKCLMRESPNWSKLSATQREGLEMIVHKLGRVLHGDAKLIDSIRDVIGYATLIQDELMVTEGATDVLTTRVQLLGGAWVTGDAK